MVAASSGAAAANSDQLGIPGGVAQGGCVVNQGVEN
jgi:hypothetical protein